MLLSNKKKQVIAITACIDLKGILLSEKANLKRHLCNILEMTNREVGEHINYWQRFGMVGGWGYMTVKELHLGEPCIDVIVGCLSFQRGYVLIYIYICIIYM